MRSADDFPTEHLIGKPVTFKDDAEHVDCWHHKVGLKTGVVLRAVPSLAQKADLMAAEGLVPPELVAAEPEVPRLWVKADPCPKFPRGCELALEKDCLLILTSGEP